MKVWIQWRYRRSIASSCERMALEVNRQNPSAFYLSMNTLQGVSGEKVIDELQALAVFVGVDDERIARR